MARHLLQRLLALPLVLLLVDPPVAVRAQHLAADPASSAEERKPPNFVVIFLDDAGWGDLGANWAETPETPFLDHLAQQSLRFTDFHAAASVCTPSRASLLTGRLGLRTGVVDNFRQGSVGGLPLSEVTLAEHLRDQGRYRTAMAGKWHLGTHPPFHPTYRGFQRYLGVPYSVDMGCTDVPGADLPARHRCCPFRPKAGNGNKQQQQVEMEATAAGDLQLMRTGVESDYAKYGCFNAPAVPLYNSTDYGCSGKGSCNDDIVEQPVNLTSLSRRYSDFAERFIEEHAALNAAPGRKEPPQPFFLYMALAHMHVPLAYDPQFEQASPRTGDARIYGNALAEVDHEIGRVVQALHRTGLANDTLVFITSDNGPWDMKCGLAGLKGPYEGKYLTQHYKGATGKFTCWEGGHRVPALAYWPGTITPGVTPALASTLDFFPTFSRLAGLGLPSDRQYDGVDLAPLLLHRDRAHPPPEELKKERVLFHPDQYGDLSAMRVGRKKVHFHVTRAPPCVQPTRAQPVLPDVDEVLAGWKFVVGPQEEGWNHPVPLPLVFDLETDPAEEHPLHVTPEEKARYEGLLVDKLHDIRTTLRSAVDYSKREDPSGWPCCSTTQPDCGCDTWATVHYHTTGQGGKAVEG